MIVLRRCAAAICALGLGTAVTVAPAFADDIELGEGTPTAVTGIAWDDEAGEVLVTDDRGTITARTASAGEERSVPFTGAPESVQALGLFKEFLYIGDIGDETGDRDYVTVFRIDPAAENTNYRAWDFSYPEGAHDAKAMAISGKGRIYLVTSGDDPGIYLAGLEPSRTDINTLTRAADAPSGVTDAVFLGDGSTLMLRTEVGVELIDAYTWEVQAATTYVDGPEGESLTVYTPDRILVGGGTHLRDEPLPSGMTTATPVPSGEPTSSPSASDTAPQEAETASATTAPEESQTQKVSRRGTLFALLGAGAVAILAGVVVFVARD